MEVLFANTVIVFICSYLGSYKGNYLSKGIEIEGYRKFFLLIAILSLCSISGLRDFVGTDYELYSTIYYRLATTDISVSLKDYNNDLGFVLLCKLLGFISLDDRIFFIVTSLIINLLFYNSLKRYATPFELAVFLFITSYHYYTSFNIIRQYLAMAVVFWATKYLISRKFITFIVFIVLASTFHLSAIIMIPVAFIARRSFNISTILILIITTLGAYFGYESIIRFGVSSLNVERYKHYIDVLTRNERSSNIIYFFVWLVLTILLVLFRKKIIVKMKNYDLFLNLYMMSGIFQVLAWKHNYLFRLGLYFDMYGLVIIPMLTRIFDKSMNAFVYVSIIIIYFIYSTFLLLRGIGGILPYQWGF